MTDELIIKTEEEGIKKQIYLRPYIRNGPVPYLRCPLCGMLRPMHRSMISFIRRLKKGSTYIPAKETSFDCIDITKTPFLIFKVSRGRKGFIEVLSLTIPEIKSLSKEDQEIIGEFLIQIKRQCKTIIKTLEEEGW